MQTVLIPPPPKQCLLSLPPLPLLPTQGSHVQWSARPKNSLHYCGWGMLCSVSPCPPPASEVSSAQGHTWVWLQGRVRANQAMQRGRDAHQPGLAAPETSSHVLASQCCFDLSPKLSCWGMGCPPPLTFVLMPPDLHLLSVLRKPQLLVAFSSKDAMGTVSICKSPPGSTPCPLGAWEGVGAAWHSAGSPHTPNFSALGLVTLTLLPILLSFTSRWFLLIPVFLPGTPLEAFFDWRSY